MNNQKIHTVIEEVFSQECEVIDLRYEYGKEYTGKEKYGIITALTDEELNEKFGDILIEIKPYIILPLTYGIVRKDFRRNEKKFEMRYLRGHYFTIDDEFEEHHPECATFDFVPEMMDTRNEHIALMVQQAFSKLTDIQKDVVRKHIFAHKSILQISKDLGKNEKTVRESYAAAIRKMKKFLKTPPNFDYPSGNK